MRKEGYIDNRGNYVRPGPDYQRLLMVALMNALARVLVKPSPESDINEHVLSEDWGI